MFQVHLFKKITNFIVYASTEKGKMEYFLHKNKSKTHKPVSKTVTTILWR